MEWKAQVGMKRRKCANKDLQASFCCSINIDDDDDDDDDDDFYNIALFSAPVQTHCGFVACDSQFFYNAF